MGTKMKVDINKLVLNLIIPHWRKIKIISWLYALAAPLRVLYVDLCRFRDDIEFRMQVNTQVCRLAAVLNNRFDPVGHSITITNSGDLELIYVAPASDHEEVYTDFYVADSSYYNEYEGYDFIVTVPAGIVLQEERSELEGLINYFKLVGKNARIIYL